VDLWEIKQLYLSIVITVINVKSWNTKDDMLSYDYLISGKETYNQCHFALPLQNANTFLTYGTRKPTKDCCYENEGNKCNGEQNPCSVRISVLFLRHGLYSF
jgi:hypothetical protein